MENEYSVYKFKIKYLSITVHTRMCDKSEPMYYNNATAFFSRKNVPLISLGTVKEYLT